MGKKRKKYLGIAINPEIGGFLRCNNVGKEFRKIVERNLDG